MSLLAIAGAAATLIGAGVKAWGRLSEIDAKKKELEDARNQLTTVYNQSVRQAKEETADRNAIIQTQIRQTEAAQETARKQSGASIAAQDVIYNAQIAEQQVLVSQRQGSAIQSAATSGFRGSENLSGSIGAAVRETTRSGDRAVEQARLQARAVRMQSYNSALNNYTSAEYQKELYAQQQKLNEKALTRTLEVYETEYEYKKGLYDQDIEYMDSAEYKWLTGLGIGADLVSAGVSAYTDYKDLSKKY